MNYNGRRLRHELKYEIDEERALLLRKVLLPIIRPDSNMVRPEGYLISSLYFDDCANSSMQDKLAGVNFRKKFRIRSYDRSDSFIRLECKEKYEAYIAKTSAMLTKEEYYQILAGSYDALRGRIEPVCRQLYGLSKSRLMHPVVVVEYLREAYTLPTGNVRITFDKEISASIGNLDVFAPNFITRRALPPGKIILEVKYDEFLPEYIRQALCLARAQQCSASKYVMCRDEKRMVQFQ